jgi:regulator of chromosome condensation
VKKTYPKEDDFDSSEDENDDEEGQDGDEEGGSEDFVDPVKLFALCGEGINHIAVGRVHCCAKTKDGDVFTWGQNDHCQLGKEPVHILSEAKSKKARVRYGMGTHEPQLWERSIPETCVIKAVDVGTNHTFAVTDAGEVHAFGATFHTSDHSSLTRSLAKLNVVQVPGRFEVLTVCGQFVLILSFFSLKMSCGAMHAGLVTSNGQAFTWGSGDGG